MCCATYGGSGNIASRKLLIVLFIILFLLFLKYFDFGENFINWSKTLYFNRKSYVLNNGFLTNPIDVSKGNFQRYPISPYIFFCHVCVIEALAIAIRENSKVQGIRINDVELKVPMLADDTTCFIIGSLESFNNFFNS